MYFCLRIYFACAVTSARNVVLLDSHITNFLDLCQSLLKCQKVFILWNMEPLFPGDNVTTPCFEEHNFGLLL